MTASASLRPPAGTARPTIYDGWVDTAHRTGLAVLLDVVYSHFGPDGAYSTVFSPFYRSSGHQSPWGAAINLDGDQSGPVRTFFIENALYWLHEYHLDGLRLDATHWLLDDSAPHFVAEWQPVCAKR
jgi:maltooligosyltrehalose trehalohydrolase